VQKHISGSQPSATRYSYLEAATAALKLPIVQRLILVASVLISYSNSFRGAFQFDDLSNIQIAVSQPLSRFSFYLWTNRAIGQASLALDHWLYGQNVVGFHVTNLLVHIGATLVVYGLATLTFQTPFMRAANLSAEPSDVRRSVANSIAFFTALLFAVHPIQTQAVTYIVQRFASLASLFYLASVYCYLRARLASDSTAAAPVTPRNQVLIFYFLSVLSMSLAMRTKEIAFTLPLAIVVFDILFFRGSFKTRLKFLAPFILGLLVIPLTLLSSHLGNSSAVDTLMRVKTEMPRAHYFLTQIRVLVTYLRLLVFPAEQNLDYDYTTYTSLFQVPVFVSFFGLLLLLGTAALLLHRSRHSISFPGRVGRIVALGIIWFFLTLAVESSFLPIRDVINEHRLYLPSAGIFFAVCTAVIITGEHFRRRQQILAGSFAAFGVIAAVFAFLTFQRNQVWATPLSLWTDVVRKSPNRSRPWNNLGNAYLQRDEPFKAIHALIRSYELNPGWADAPSNIALALRQLGSFEGRYHTGFELLTKDGEIQASTVAVWLPIALNNVGLAYEVVGLNSKAIEKFDRVISMAPNFAPAHLNRGLAALAAGDLERARAEQSILEAIAPTLARVLSEWRGGLDQAPRALPGPLPQTRQHEPAA